MTHRSVSTPNSGLRVFSASLLSALMIMMPFVQLAAAEKRSDARVQRPGSGKQAVEGTQQDTTKNAAPESVFLNAPIPKPAPEPLAAAIVATKDDGLVMGTTVAPNGVITYTVNIQNNGATSPVDDAVNLQFNDTIDAHTTLFANSTVAAVSDKYNAAGNTTLSIPNGSTDLLGNDVDPDPPASGTNTGMTVTAYGATTGLEQTVMGTSTPTAQGGSVTVNADGSFTYNPPSGFEGNDTFKYRAADVNGFTAITIVRITVSGMIWYIDDSAAVGGNGTLATPYNCYTGTSGGGQTCFSDSAADDPGDSIFLFDGAYTGGYTLLNNQKLLGQDATATVALLTGLTPSGTSQFPTTDGTVGGVTITTTVAATNAIPLGQGNTLRGFTVGNTTGAKISGNNFGTLIVGNNTLPDVRLNGSGPALTLTTGTLSVTGGFISVETTSSTTQGINLSGVADDGVGPFSFGSTTVTTTGQGILIGTTTADLNFGNTSITGGTNAVSFQNNSGGTRTFGTLTTSGASLQSFLHGASGGNVTVTGVASLSSAGSAISVSAPGATNAINFQAATTATSTGAGNTAVNWAGVAGATLTFNSLTITRNNGTALNATGGGTINVTNATGSITNTTAGGPAIVAANIALNANFSSITSTGGANGVSLTAVTGTSNFGTGQLTGTASGVTFLVSGGSPTITYSGNITQGAAAGMVSIIDHSSGTITFQTGTLSATLGTGIQFDNADGIYNFSSSGGTTTLAGGNAHVQIIDQSAGSFTFGANTTITSPSASPAFEVNTTPGNPTVTYSGSITQNNAQRVISIDGTTGNTITFQTGTITGGASSTGININNANGNVIFSNGMTLGTSGARMTNQAVTIAGGSGAKNLGLVSIFTTGTAEGIHSTTSTGAISATGTVNSAGAAAINIAGTSNASRTPINFDLTSLSANGGANGLILTNTSATGSPGGFRVNGTGTTDGSGGTIQNTTTRGANINNVDSLVLKNMNFTSANNSVDAGGAGVCDDLSTTACNAAIYINNVTTLATFDNINVTGTMVEHGINALNVANFKLDNSLLENCGNDGNQENCVKAQNLSGTSTVNSTEIRFAETESFVVINTDVSWNLTINGTTIRDTQTESSGGPVNTDGEGGFSFRSFSVLAGQPTTTINIVNSSFLRLRTQAIQPFAQDDTILNIDINNCTIDAEADIGTGIDLNGDDTATVNFNITGNPTIESRGGAAVNITSFLDANVEGRINSNPDIEVLGGPGIPVRLVAQETSNMIVEINGNTISNVNGTEDTAVDVQSRFQNARVDATITNNTITGEVTGVAGINLISGSSTAGESNITCGDVANNNVTNATGNTIRAFRVRNSDLSNTNRLYLEGFSVDTATTWINRGNLPADAAEVAVSLTGTAVTPSGPPGGVCLAVDISTDFVRLIPQTNDRLSTEMFVASAAPANAENNSTSNAIFLTSIASALTSSASETGARMAPVALAHNAEVRHQNSEVRDQKSEVSAHHAVAESRERNIDALSEKSERSHVARANRALAAPMSGETVTANIGTLPAGSSVTITFQVTVNSPPNLSLVGPPRVENQGTVTANGGISVLTDDPETGTAGDKTATQINLFDTTTSVTCAPDPSNTAETVTCIATVTENPSQGGVDPNGTVDFIDTSNGNAVICNDVPLTGTTAQCQTAALTAGTHNIRADYNGDVAPANFKGSQSATYPQDVIACATNPVVTKIADTNDGVCDADCSLREAIATVCTSAGNNTITFASGVGQAFENPATITLSASFGSLTIDRDATIQGPAHGVTVVGSGNASHRVFVVNASKTATIAYLTITGGNSDAIGGGGIKNDGTLTLKNSTVSGNATTQNGAGIHNSNVLNIVNSTISGNTSSIDGGGLVQDGAAPTLYMVNSTVSGNTANGFGGGLDLRNGTVTILNSTITGNHGDNDNGSGGGAGGLRQQTATVTIRNTIVAGNYVGSGTTTANDIEGTVAGNNNLIGDTATAGGLTNGVNGNIVGAVIANVLDTVLANNGGPTKTHRLITGSVALDAGENGSLPTDTFDADGDANTGESLDVDQRGQPRVVDNPNVTNVTGGLDIGAYEAPAPPNTPDLDAASDTGASNTDNYTSDSTPTFTIGGVTAGDTVHLLRNGTSVANGVAVGASIQLTDPAAPDGTHSYSARRIVAGGASPDSAGLSVTIDTGAPGTPTIDLQAASDSGSSNSDDITNAATRTFDIGNTETGATVELLRDGNPITSTTGTGGTVTLSDSTAAVSGTTYAYTARQTDGGGNQTTSTAVNVLFDTTAPAVSSIVRANANPTSAASVDFTVTFSENVTGVDTTDFTLTTTGVSGASITTVTPVTGSQYTVTVNTGSGDGTIRLDLTDNDSIADIAGNVLGGAGAQNFTTGEVYTVDKSAPTANITDVTPDPRTTAVSSITIVFTEAVTGFDLADLSLTLNGGANLLTGAQTLSSGDGGITWTLGNLGGITGAQGTYLLTLTAAGSGITDTGGNALAGDATDTWVVDTTAPTVTINQAAGQSDPTSGSPINFTVVFSEPVTGFANTDVTFSGAGSTTATVTEVAPNDGTTYNVAISGMNADGTVQATVNVNAAQDGAGNNSAASTSTDNQVTFVSTPDVSIQDAQVPEPASPNTIDMTFTVALSSPASGPVAVSFTTNNGSATAGTCGNPGADYVTTTGTINFIAGEQVKTVNVPICSDAVADNGETFTVTLNTPVGVNIADGTATGTITANTAGPVLISEIRTSGPAGADDDFVEIYNNSNAPLTVAASDSSAGYGLYKRGADCNAAPVLIGVIPNGTVIPARGHYLFVGSAYSLTNYGGTGAAAGNLTFSSALDNDANVGLFTTSDVTKVSSVNRLDAVGFGANVGGACNLLREGSNLPAMSGSTLEYSFFRKMCDWISGSGCTVPGIPKDTNQNADDFWLADTTNSVLTNRLGAPGPENLASPIRRDNSGINVFLLDGNVAASANPNRSRDNTLGVTPVAFGTMTLRYRVTNNTGAPVTRLRYRIVDISTANQPPGPVADLRALTSSIESNVGPVNDPATCALVPAATPCTVTVQATTLETPPAQPNGGGYNSTLSSGTITTGTPLNNGNSIMINFKLGVNKTGQFRFYIIVEALP